MSRVSLGHLRLARWRASRFLRTALPIGNLLLLTVACGLVSRESGGSSTADSEERLAIPPVPGLSKTQPREIVGPSDPRPWAYVLPLDYGVRADESGKGHFRAPRFHGEHNGIDLLAPVGTPVFAACDGEVMAGASESFGRWLHVVCPVPGPYASSGRPWASFFYAHLAESEYPTFEWHAIKRGDKLGSVGKSGNARGPNIQPHLHLELIVQQSRRSAMEERHVGGDQSTVAAAAEFEDSLVRLCLDPLGFHPKSQKLRRARRVDPFLALTCLSETKPDFRRAPMPLKPASLAWDEFYVARNFNVNLGPEGRSRRR